MESTSQLWVKFLDGSLQRRLRGEQFEGFAEELYKRSPIMGRKLAEILVERQKMLSGVVDPLLPVYADCLLDAKRINAGDLLGALFKNTRHYTAAKTAGDQASEPVPDKEYNPLELEYTVLDQLTRAFAPGGSRPKTQEETRAALRVLSEWMSAMATVGDALIQTLDQQSILVIDSLGMLGIAMIENPKVIGIIDTALPKDTRKSLSQALSSFVPYWTHASPQHVQSAGRLEVGQRNRSLVDDSLNPATHEGTLDVAAAIQVGAVVDLNTIHTRPGIFVFISSLLVGCPLTDESMMMNYLHVRYKGDIQSLAVDLAVAGFDVLAGAVARNESSQTMFGLKSFLVNKIPTLLATLSGSMFPPLTPEYCITQALSHIDLNTFPSFGLGIMSDSVLQDVRQGFIYGCTLHGLLPAESVDRLLGEQPFTPPPSHESRYHKDNLVDQCSTEPGKVVQLIGELEKLDGNAAAIVAGVTEFIRLSCATKDTMTLKSICNSLSGKPQFLDVMLQFTSPASILRPLCQLLDAWRYEEDQGEYQPVYDDFASIFLLVLTFVYRYHLSHTELGISRDSFVANYFEQGHKSLLDSELSDEQRKHLGSWLKGLFDTDGITEEVTGSCRPQQFYLMVPTIFSQTVLACSKGALGMDAVKNGLEYLLDPFLLPSLVGAIYWITAYVREQPGADVDILLQMLQRITRAPASGDAQAMHATIMSIVTLPLTNCLKVLRKSNPKRNDIEPILSIVKQHEDFRRGPYSPCNELHGWNSSPGAFKQVLLATFRSLIIWSTSAGINPTQGPPHYNHRLFLISERVLGASAVLSVLLDELKAQTESPTGAAAVALDIATAIVCAPKTENSPIEIGWVTSPVPAQPSRRTKRLNLRDALKLEFDIATDLIQKDQTMGETVVRLHQRVEAQLALGVAPIADLAAPMPTILPDLGMTADATAAGAVQQPLDFTQDTSTTLDLSGSDTMQLDLSVGDGGMGLLGTQSLSNDDDDVFAGIDLSDALDVDLDLGF